MLGCSAPHGRERGGEEREQIFRNADEKNEVADGASEAAAKPKPDPLPLPLVAGHMRGDEGTREYSDDTAIDPRKIVGAEYETSPQRMPIEMRRVGMLGDEKIQLNGSGGLAEIWNGVFNGETNVNDESNRGRSGNDYYTDDSDSSILTSNTGSVSLDSDCGDDDCLDLPAGFLAFLSDQQANVENELSEITDRLRRNDKDVPVLFLIELVRKSIHDAGTIKIAQAMEEGFSNYCTKRLISPGGCIDANNIETEVNDAVSRSIPCQCPSRHLREIILSRCHVGDEGVWALARAFTLSCIPSLKIVDLSSNHITGIGVNHLAECVIIDDGESRGSSRGIETLILSSNPIGSAGALALAGALKGQRWSCTDFFSETLCCSLRELHLSKCEIGDEGSNQLASALVPDLNPNDGVVPRIVSTLPVTNHLMVLNLLQNRITLRGMEYLYSIVHNSSFVKTMNGGGNDSDRYCCLRNLSLCTNHVVEIRVISDYGTRDYNYGYFFDQEEDEQLLMNMRKIEKMGVQSCPRTDLEDMKTLMMYKWLLKEKMMHALHVNKRCALALEDMYISAPSNGKSEADLSSETLEERTQIILTAGARAKITRMLKEKICPSPITFPKRQDEYGKHLEEEDFFGIGHVRCESSLLPSIGKLFTRLDLNIFHYIIRWINGQFSRHQAMTIVFDILGENPDVCAFHPSRANFT